MPLSNPGLIYRQDSKPKSANNKNHLPVQQLQNVKWQIQRQTDLAFSENTCTYVSLRMIIGQAAASLLSGIFLVSGTDYSDGRFAEGWVNIAYLYLH